ncbi:3-oxo-5a-steroid 4- dehydrogenase [Arthrobotrys musiformis]|uniref:3-oxo-5a-steroid 4- dehydrogenase n=1 Tax=Arthrobotrys musiformis TaxID=47236 RepID=A0AAV9VZW7_9PEZI
MGVENITLRLTPRGAPLPKLPAELPISSDASIDDLYDAVGKLTGYSRHRLRITKSDSSHLKPSSTVTVSDSNLFDQSSLFVKDLGLQIDWQTVFVIEYLGPLLIHPLFILFRNQIYGFTPPFVPWAGTPSSTPPTSTQLIICTMVILHYIKRELETLFVHRFSSATMPLSSLIRNTSYYWTMGGIYLGYFLYAPSTAEAQPLTLYAGLAIWLFAELSNFKTHLTLRGLRRAGSTDRGIPTGYGFNLVTCPNYMFEVLGWFAVAMISGWKIPALVFWGSGLYIQTKWAGQKERRYRKEFGDKYKKKRNVIIPFVL